jgi:uncharacterized protein YndB with AHSA1/START domain
MPGPGYAVLEDDEGRALLRFERVLPHPPERVWSALTAQEELYGWHPTPFELEPAVGGAIRFDAGGHGPEMPDGEVLEYDPPRTLAHTWGEDRLRWELEPHTQGCRLVLTHRFEDRFKAARDATGWDMCLEALASVLESPDAPRPERIDRVSPGWSELNHAYQERFGIPAELATPPPRSS